MIKTDFTRLAKITPAQLKVLDAFRQLINRSGAGITLINETAQCTVRWNMGESMASVSFTMDDIDDGKQKHTHCDFCHQETSNLHELRFSSPDCATHPLFHVCYDCRCPQ